MTDQKTGTAQEQKLLRLVRVQTVLIALLLAALSVFVILTARSLNRMDRSLDLVEQDLAAMDMDQVNGAVEALTNAANRLSGVDLSGGLAGGSGRGRAEHRSRLAGQGCGYAQGSGYQFPERDHLVAGPGH